MIANKRVQCCALKRYDARRCEQRS
jgi:hypothetical protein